MLDIKRSVTSDIENAIKHSQKVIIIYGPRQVGKTTLVKNIVQRSRLKPLFINGDRRDQHNIISSRDLTQMKALLGDTQLLIIDEGQNIPDIGINLKILYDELPELKIIVTGSSSLDLADRTQEPLTGRTDTHMLYPITIAELVFTTSAIETNNQLNQLLTYGMYPEVINQPSIKNKIKRLRELTTSYLYKDILSLGNIKYSLKLQKLVKLLAYQIGQLVSIQELSQALQISQDTVVNYIDKLEKAFVIYRLSALSNNPRKEISKRDKIYFYDIGVRNAVINNFNDIELRNDKGHIWENFLISERIKKNTYQGYYGSNYFWRSYGGAEVDYIEQYDDQLDGYEFKYKSKKPRPPQSWLAYPNASCQQIHKSNYLSFVLEQNNVITQT